MNLAHATFATYTQFGVLNDLVGLSLRFDAEAARWVITGKFQNANGTKFGKVAEFDRVEDAVEFERLAGF